MTLAIPLPDKLDTAGAPAFLQTLCAAKGGPLVLDASATRGIGAICAQILIAAHVAWETEGHALSLIGTAGIADDLQLLGLVRLCDDMGSAA